MLEDTFEILTLEEYRKLLVIDTKLLIPNVELNVLKV
jgi:hypothetical protein